LNHAAVIDEAQHVNSSTSVHVVLGDVAAATFANAFGRSASVLIDQDVLSCGPTPRCDDIDQWRAIRARFWRELVPDLANQHVPSPNSVLDNLHRLRSAERIRIWSATSVSHQVFVAFICHLLRADRIDASRVELVQFEHSARSGLLVTGIGELDPDQLREHPAPRALAGSLMTEYLAAWDALTSPDALALARFGSDHATTGEWLKRAMHLLLRRFPEKQSGLPHWDFKLLESVRQSGPNASRMIGDLLAQGRGDGDTVGDAYLFGRLLRLGDPHKPRPLVEVSADRKNIRNVTVTLTSFGEAVLEARASNLEQNPIDEWAGGVHLSSADHTVWVHDEERLVKL